MNLEWKHCPLLFLGGVIGAGLGWLASFLFKPDILPAAMESLANLHRAGALFGSIAGLAFAVVAIVVRAARDPNAGPARNFTRINGMGSMLIGRSEPRADQSYVTTEWFTILWIPLFPVCRYRLTHHEECSTPFGERYSIHEKMPPRFNDAAKVYGITVLILIGIIGVLYLTDFLATTSVR